MRPTRDRGARRGHPEHHPFNEGHVPFHHPGGGPRGPENRGHHRPGGRGRAPRGDVRAAVLLLLFEEPMHGYQLMQAVADRTDGRWTPSPGAVYPTINHLEDEGLVTVTAGAGRKLATLTDAGRGHVEQGRAEWPDPFGGFETGAPGDDLRGQVQQLVGAVRQVGRAGSDAQRNAAAKILGDARRALYLLLADGPQGRSDAASDEAS